MYQHSQSTSTSSQQDINQDEYWAGTTNRRVLRVVNPDIDPETGSESPTVPEIQPSLDLPPRFRRFLSEYYLKGNGHNAAINWYQTALTASDVKDRDTAGLTELEEILRLDTRLSGTSTSPRWVAKKTLGSGKYGKVVLWERKMGTNKQPEYVACKDCDFDKWFKDYCAEAHLTRRVNVAGCVNVVKVFDWVSIRSSRSNRILYEYCPHGTLYDLYRFYGKKCRVTIPEAFLWHVFHSLATVICYHAYGTTDGQPTRNWNEIVHRDIKPLNILLSDPELNNRDLYPTLKLADYGLAYSIPNDEIRRLKRTMWSGGTPGYVAPEVNSRIRDDPNQTPHPIASHLSDVYSIGCTMIDFLRLPMSRYSKASWELLDLDLDFSYQYYPYSRDLVDLARQCVKPDPKDRPSAIDLYQRTRRHVEESYDLVEKASQANYLRPGTAFAGQMLWNNTMQERYTANDHFRNAYKNANDWTSTHSHAIRQLDQAAMNPQEDNIPPSGHVAIGNGLGGYCSLAQLTKDFVGVPFESYLATMKVYDLSGNVLMRDGGEPILRFIGQDRLLAPEPNPDWQQVTPTRGFDVQAHGRGRPKLRADELPQDDNP